jgi:hypothetical protein
MKSQGGLEVNPRGIPKAPFIVSVSLILVLVAYLDFFLSDILIALLKSILSSV